MDVTNIRERITAGEYEIRHHAEKERYAEEISISDVETIHIVCGHTPLQWVRIITLYLPKPPKWIDERTRVKGGDVNA